MELIIISPNGKLTASVAWIELCTLSGCMIVQHGHTPAIVVLKPHSSLTFRLTSGKEESIVILQGIVVINRTKTEAVINDPE